MYADTAPAIKATVGKAVQYVSVVWCCWVSTLHTVAHLVDS